MPHGDWATRYAYVGLYCGRSRNGCPVKIERIGRYLTLTLTPTLTLALALALALAVAVAVALTLTLTLSWPPMQVRPRRPSGVRPGL